MEQTKRRGLFTSLPTYLPTIRNDFSTWAFCECSSVSRPGWTIGVFSVRIMVKPGWNFGVGAIPLAMVH